MFREYPLASHDSYSLTGCSWAIGTLGYGPGFAYVSRGKLFSVQEYHKRSSSLRHLLSGETYLGSNNSSPLFLTSLDPLEEITTNSPLDFSPFSAAWLCSKFHLGVSCYFLNCADSFTVVVSCYTSTSPTNTFFFCSEPLPHGFGSVAHNSCLFRVAKIMMLTYGTASS